MTDPEQRIERARLRAKGRETLQRMGMSEEDLPLNVRLESVGYIRRPDELTPAEMGFALARGKVLARKYGW